ncbi:hypothetical protein DTO013E5_6523 [Penicillium roqueforti]|nr:hypothetical protein CBS147337_2452 [Penicillium roqueforti]KAI2684835.1 hypothetical protein LCP963914a_4927 [Penicillium roqueforti]KAI2704618.1 hypothetical protein CBS147372_3087 [Penicillium roqueforti]KAI2715541.1 hypothetical protein CBS147318_6141 [Penicillium roqueforti]KAI2719343.1 hypothetical protein CBS147354_6208 [Penicillium roqueforti]
MLELLPFTHYCRRGGDGSPQIISQEVNTMVRRKLGITLFVVCNEITRWNALSMERVRSATLSSLGTMIFTGCFQADQLLSACTLFGLGRAEYPARGPIIWPS